MIFNPEVNIARDYDLAEDHRSRDWVGLESYENEWKHGETGEKLIMQWQIAKLGNQFLCEVSIYKPDIE